MKKFFKGLFKRTRYHHETRDMPPWVRRRMYRELIQLIQEEHQVSEMLNLPIPPRLCVVDEVRVAMLRPNDRAMLLSDHEMQRAREDALKERQRKESERLRSSSKSD